MLLSNATCYVVGGGYVMRAPHCSLLPLSESRATGERRARWGHVETADKIEQGRAHPGRGQTSAGPRRACQRPQRPAQGRRSPPAQSDASLVDKHVRCKGLERETKPVCLVALRQVEVNWALGSFLSPAFMRGARLGGNVHTAHGCIQ